jgi:hypothetical protein
MRILTGEKKEKIKLAKLGKTGEEEDTPLASRLPTRAVGTIRKSITGKEVRMKV